MALKEKSFGFMAPCACCAPTLSSAATRRNVLTGSLAALGLGAAAATLGVPAVRAQSPAKTRIDVHHHYVPPAFADAIATRRAGGRPPKWSVQMSLDEMDKSDIATAIVSLVQPATWLADDVPGSRRLTRECNEYGAKMVQDHPGRFGLFATIAPPDSEGSLKEIEYALDTLKADGIGLMTSYGDKYLGDKSFEPVWAELNRRKVLVYVHPTAPACCTKTATGIGLSPGTVEYATDSTRTIGQLVISGTAAKFPDIRWIFSHSGGTLPFLTGRFIRFAHERKLPDPMPTFRKFYYELAQGNTPGQIAALLKLVAVSQVLYGTDYPFRDGAEVNDGIATWGFNAADLRNIERDTANKLIPRLKSI